MPRNASRPIIEEECLPVLKHFHKIKGDGANNLEIHSSTLNATQTQRRTLENLTNKIPESTNAEIEPHLSHDENLNKTDSNIGNSCHPSDYTIAPAIAKVNTLYPTVVEKSVEKVNNLSLEGNVPCSTVGENASVPLKSKRKTKSFNIKIKAKENHRLASLRARTRKSQTPLEETQAVFRYIDETTLNRIESSESCQTQLLDKPIQAIRRKSKTLSIGTWNTSKSSENLSTQKKREYHNSTSSSSCEEKTQKRPCIMSLYERRYQTDDGRGVVSNGYLGSSRNSSAASSGVHSDDNADISNQYYIAASSAAASSSALSNGSSSNYAQSMATLCNIGNTCYLNSVVYTLRFAPQFVHNLHHLVVDLSNIQQNIVKYRAKSSSLGRNMTGTQMENVRSWSSKDLASLENYNAAVASSGTSSQLETRKSNQQLLTEKLHELYQNLHRNEIEESSEPFHADTLLHAIQEVSSIFEGNQQQDAHEFLMCVLNSIRETCQTLIKAISDCPDVIMNGCMANTDNSDPQNSTEKDVTRSTSSQVSSGNSSSLSTSNITKALFTRKSKRKEDSKNSKNQRLQSPLKENAQATGSNSLFYLNTVDLSGANGKPNTNDSLSANLVNQSASASTTTATLSNSLKAQTESQGGDDTDSPIATLKDKERLSEKIKQLGLDFFSEDFEGITVSTTKCLSCETITEQKESMIDIAVPVPISGFDNTDYMDKSSSFIQNSCITREYFRGENKYRCEQCTGYTEAIRSISYEVLPRLLVIQLSRFSGGMEKINSYIPTSFTLQCFCAKCCELSDSNKLHIYKLYSVITHVGATMSVGHYIAYTCSLGLANEYVNCPKDMRRNQQYGSSNGLQNNGGTPANSNVSSSQSSASSAASALATSGTNIMKKIKLARSKASSSGDMSKNVKNLNGVTSKTITNGIGKLSMNPTCHSIRCCATRVKGSDAMSASNSSASSVNGGLYASNSSDHSDENLPNGTNHHSNNASYNYPSGYGSTGRGGSKSSHSSNSSTEPIWYMCDDDKIKAMTQREFEDLLSPSRKITITPYLLFYARIDLQPTTQPTPPKSAPTTSWSNDALQRGQLDKM